MKGKEVTAEEEREITVEAEMKAHIEEEIEVTVVMARREVQIEEEMSSQVIIAVVSTVKIQEKTGKEEDNLQFLLEKEILLQQRQVCPLF